MARVFRGGPADGERTDSRRTFLERDGHVYVREAGTYRYLGQRCKGCDVLIMIRWLGACPMCGYSHA